MKLVIEISDNMKDLLESGHPEVDGAMALWKAIQENYYELKPCDDCISREALNDSYIQAYKVDGEYRVKLKDMQAIIDNLPSVEPRLPRDPGEISDGYHTFNQLYHQRAILFAAIVNQNKSIS